MLSQDCDVDVNEHPLSTYALRGRGGGGKEMTNFCVR